MSPFWQNVLRFQRDKIGPWIGLRNAIGVALSLAAGAAVGAVPSGLVMATGALNVSFSDSYDPYIVRAGRMLAASLVVAIGVFAGALCGNNNALVVGVSAAWAFAAGLLVALGTAPADLGAVSLVTLVVFAATPQTPERAVLSGCLAFAGGLVETALALALWPIRPYGPERQALGNLYVELAQLNTTPPRPLHPPPASSESTQAQTMLSVLDREHSLQAERYRALLSQAERARLALMLLGRLRIRLEREVPEAPGIALFDHAFAIASGMLQEIGDALLADRPARAEPQSLAHLQDASDALRDASEKASPEPAALLRDARYQLDALAGQLRSALDLAAHASAAGAFDFARREAARPWHLRAADPLAILRANLSLRSASCRHAIRLSACVALAEIIGRYLELRRSYWLPMTVAIVLKPDFSATFSRGVLRLAGTFAGLGIATALFHLLPAAAGVEIGLIGLFTFLARTLGPANYGAAATPITAVVVLLLALNGASPASVMPPRALNTALGGAIALAAYWLWPTWERTQVYEALARLLDAYRDYFRVIRRCYEQPDVSLAAEADRARTAGRLARSNAEASVDRLTAEPGTSPERMHLLSSMLASSHRLAHAMMALEAGLTTSPAPARPAFRKLADDVEFTLYYLASALRGAKLRREDLPDLREDHRALGQSGNSSTERYALVNVETDRIVNSLNTLAEGAFRWIG